MLWGRGSGAIGLSIAVALGAACAKNQSKDTARGGQGGSAGGSVGPSGGAGGLSMGGASAGGASSGGASTGGAAGSGGAVARCSGAPGNDQPPPTDISVGMMFNSLSNQSTSAMNTLDVYRLAPWPERPPGVQAGSTCGDVGFAFVGSGGQLEFIEVGGTVETASPTAGANDTFSLFYDDNCTPRIVTGTLAGVAELVQGAGSWSSTTVGDLPAILGSAPNSFTYLQGVTGRDGRHHVFAIVDRGSGDELVHGSAPADFATWTFDVYPFPPADRIYDFGVDSTGAVHAVFTNTQFPCDPCDVGLYHGAIGGGSTTWDVMTIDTGIWGPPEDVFASNPTLAIAPNDDPVVAAHFVRRGPTGSFIATELRAYFHDPAGSYCFETVTSQNGSYVGADGPSFTGAHPEIAVDDAGRVFLAFSDLSVFHDSVGENAIPGSLRLGVRSGGEWMISTIYEQPGQSQSANPLVGFFGTDVMLMNAEAYIGGVEFSWSTDTIYLTSDAPVDFDLVSASVTVRF